LTSVAHTRHHHCVLRTTRQRAKHIYRQQHFACIRVKRRRFPERLAIRVLYDHRKATKPSALVAEARPAHARIKHALVAHKPGATRAVKEIRDPGNRRLAAYAGTGGRDNALQASAIGSAHGRVMEHPALQRQCARGLPTGVGAHRLKAVYLAAERRCANTRLVNHARQLCCKHIVAQHTVRTSSRQKLPPCRLQHKRLATKVAGRWRMNCEVRCHAAKRIDLRHRWWMADELHSVPLGHSARSHVTSTTADSNTNATVEERRYVACDNRARIEHQPSGIPE